MRLSPNDIGAKLQKFITVWRQAIDEHEIAADKQFMGMTLAEFRQAVAPSFAAREKLKALRLEVLSWIVERNTADKKSMKAALNVVAGIVGDADFGDNSSLYERMGYVRKSERKSGLTRKRKAAPATASAENPA